jgi:geranylgeranyl reductase family protein
METCDVLIVGGGPAGSSCALGLRDAGLDVLVLDRKRFPRDKTCAGWITPQVLEELEIDPEHYAKERVLQPILGFRTRRIGDPDVEVKFERPVSYGIRRCEFDHFLLERCEARLRLGEGLTRLQRVGDRWIVNDSIETPLVVGAGGHFCPVGRRLSEAGDDGEPIVAAQEIEFELDAADRGSCPVEAEVPELFFTADLKGYGWVFRKGDFLNVGLGRQGKYRLSDHVGRFLEFLRREGKLPRHLPEGFRGHAYLLYGQAPRRLVDDGALLVGDAAGLAYPRSGEGIRPAVESGLLAARSIEAAAGCYDRTSLAPYRQAIEERYGKREPRLALGLTDLLPATLARRLAGKLLATPWFARRIVVERWFVHAHEPALPALERSGPLD